MMVGAKGRPWDSVTSIGGGALAAEKFELKWRGVVGNGKVSIQVASGTTAGAVYVHEGRCVEVAVEAARRYLLAAEKFQLKWRWGAGSGEVSPRLAGERWQRNSFNPGGVWGGAGSGKDSTQMTGEGGRWQRKSFN